jgi:hypothetical protein
MVRNLSGIRARSECRLLAIRMVREAAHYGLIPLSRQGLFVESSAYFPMTGIVVKIADRKTGDVIAICDFEHVEHGTVWAPRDGRFEKVWQC